MSDAWCECTTWLLIDHVLLIEDSATGMHIWDLHVWVHERNPEGVFSLPNPRFANVPGCVPLDEL